MYKPNLKAIMVFALLSTSAGLYIISKKGQVEPHQTQKTILAPHDNRQNNKELGISTPSQPDFSKNAPTSSTTNNDKQRAQQNDFASLIEYLASSSHPDDQLLHALITSRNNTDELSILRNLLASDPQNPLLLYAIVSHCDDPTASRSCSEQELDTLKKLDGNNGFVDELLARTAIRDGNDHEALLHLKQAAKADNQDNYFWRDLKLAAEMYKRKNDQLTLQDLSSAIGMTATFNKKDFGSSLALCREREQFREWADTCKKLGENLLQNGNALASKALGANMAGTFPGNASVKTDWEVYYDQVKQDYAQFGDLVEHEPSMRIDENVWDQFIQEYQSQGEVKAYRYLLEQLEQQMR